MGRRKNMCWLKAPLLVFCLLLLFVLFSLCSSTLASCRHGSLNCHGDKSCWSGSNNSAVPADCKCCRGYPFYPGGECHRDCSRNSHLYLLQLQQRLLPSSAANGAAANGASNGGGGGAKAANGNRNGSGHGHKSGGGGGGNKANAAAIEISWPRPPAVRMTSTSTLTSTFSFLPLTAGTICAT